MLSFVIISARIVSLIALFNLGQMYCAATPTSATKPDLQKVYDEALNWSKTKLALMPDTQDSHDLAGIGVCHGATVGKPLIIKPPCPKKQRANACHDSTEGDQVDVKAKAEEYIDADADQTPQTVKQQHADILAQATNSRAIKASPKILVFVSFSMPKASLKALAYEAHKHNAVLVMQGLKDDSFKMTQQAFFDLVSDGLTSDGLAGSGQAIDPTNFAKISQNIAKSGIQGFEVNPELFKAYKIVSVPVFVLVKDTQEISRLSGNVSLEYAAKKLKESI